MRQQSENRGGGALIGEIVQHLVNLFRHEIRLARREVQEGINRASLAIGLLVASIIIALTALHTLAGAAVMGVIRLGVDPLWAALLVGGVLVFGAIVLLTNGIARLRITKLAPTRTAENIKRDVEAIRGAVHE